MRRSHPLRTLVSPHAEHHACRTPAAMSCQYIVAVVSCRSAPHREVRRGTRTRSGITAVCQITDPLRPATNKSARVRTRTREVGARDALRYTTDLGTDDPDRTGVSELATRCSAL